MSIQQSSSCNPFYSDQALPGTKAVPTHMLLLDVMLLKNPVGHAPHLGLAVPEPAAIVNLPGGQLVWAMQTSVLLLEDNAL